MIVFFCLIWLHTGSQPSLSTSTVQPNRPATMEGPQVELSMSYINHSEKCQCMGSSVYCAVAFYITLNTVVHCFPQSNQSDVLNTWLSYY